MIILFRHNEKNFRDVIVFLHYDTALSCDGSIFFSLVDRLIRIANVCKPYEFYLTNHSEVKPVRYPVKNNNHPTV